MASEIITIGVTFKVKVNTDGTTKSAEFSVDKLKVRAKQENVTIVWTLTQQDTSWSTPGIVFGADWPFGQPTLQGDGTYKISYVNNVITTTDYKYTINVEHGLLGAPGGVQVLSFDPEVQNQPPGGGGVGDGEDDGDVGKGKNKGRDE